MHRKALQHLQHEASVAHRAVCTCAWAASFKQQPAQHTLEEHALGHAVGIAAFIVCSQAPILSGTHDQADLGQPFDQSAVCPTA